MVRVRRPAGAVVDTCGTGGDGLSTFNVSTAVAFVVAGAGVTVAKHGNRSASSRCGSADVLAALGIPFLEDPEDLARSLEEQRLAFLHAPLLHPAMRHAAPVRRALGIRTVLNLCGPLANPAGVEHQLVGVPDAPTARLLARVLRRLGSVSAWVVTSEEGMDELSVSGPSLAVVLSAGRIEERRIDPVGLGMSRARLEDITGGSAEENAARIEAVLGGRAGPDRDIVLLNAAAALVVAGAAPGLAEGMRQAGRSLDSGAASKRLNGLRAGAPGGAAAEMRGQT
jgi:anthranilate phosphoribosyltransferase